MSWQHWMNLELTPIACMWLSNWWLSQGKHLEKRVRVHKIKKGQGLPSDCMLSPVWLFAALWTVTPPLPNTLECVAISSSRDLPQRGIKPLSPVSPALQADPLLLTPLITSSHYLKFSPCHSLTMNLPLFSLLNVFLPCPLEKGMATHSSILAWKITWTEEPRGL